MTVAQVAGGGLGAILAGVLVASLQKYVGYSIDPAAAASIVTAMTATLGWVAHGVDVYGIRGVLGRLWRGRPAK